MGQISRLDPALGINERVHAYLGVAAESAFEPGPLEPQEIAVDEGATVRHATPRTEQRCVSTNDDGKTNDLESPQRQRCDVHRGSDCECLADARTASGRGCTGVHDELAWFDAGDGRLR